MHIPAPRLHFVRYYGWYSHVSRARRGGATEPFPVPAREGDLVEAGDAAQWPTRSQRRRLGRQWAQLIRRVYEADPLLCRCGEKMRILSFITDPPVVTKILEHLRRTRRDPSRAPPSATEAPLALAS